MRSAFFQMSIVRSSKKKHGEFSKVVQLQSHGTSAGFNENQQILGYCSYDLESWGEKDIYILYIYRWPIPRVFHRQTSETIQFISGLWSNWGIPSCAVQIRSIPFLFGKVPNNRFLMQPRVIPWSSTYWYFIYIYDMYVYLYIYIYIIYTCIYIYIYCIYTYIDFSVPSLHILAGPGDLGFLPQTQTNQSVSKAGVRMETPGSLSRGAVWTHRVGSVGSVGLVCWGPVGRFWRCLFC